MEKELSKSDDDKYLPLSSVQNGVGIEVLPDIYCFTTQISNIVFVGKAKSDQFVLIDAGMPKSVDAIIHCVEQRFGKNAKPQAILLTHGHFDHVGAIIDLVNLWGIPVYAHSLELPYLTGQKAYPTPDASVEGGLIAKISPIFPIQPIDLGHHIHPLPEDGTVPFLPAFQFIPTPGHSTGHVSFFRESDRTLIVGDAFTTVKQDALYNVLTQKLTIEGPPRYLTPDWETAWQSVKLLRNLTPNIAITGHGKPISGHQLTEALNVLDEQFDTIAIPEYGQFITHDDA